MLRLLTFVGRRPLPCRSRGMVLRPRQIGFAAPSTAGNGSTVGATTGSAAVADPATPPTVARPVDALGTSEQPRTSTGPLSQSTDSQSGSQYIVDSRALHALARSGDLAAMETHFAAMPQHDIVSFSIVIKQFVRRRNLHRAADYLERLLASELKMPDRVLVTGILKYLSESPGSPGEERVLDLIRRSGFPAAGDRALVGQVRHLDGFEAQERYVQLLQAIGVALDVATLTSLIDAAAQARNVERAERYFAQIGSLGLQPEPATYTALIDCYRRVGRHERCFELEQRLRADGVPLDQVQYTLLMSAAGHARQPERVRSLFDEYLQLAERDATMKRPRPVVTFTTALCGAVNCDDFDGARRYLRVMRERGVVPTVRTALSLSAILNMTPVHREVGRQLRRAIKPRRLWQGDEDRLLTAAENTVLDSVILQLSTKVSDPTINPEVETSNTTKEQ